MILTEAQLEDLLTSQAMYTVGSGYDRLIPGAVAVRDSTNELIGYRSPGIDAIDQVVASIAATGGNVVGASPQGSSGGRSVPEPNDTLRTQILGSVDPPAMTAEEKKTMWWKLALLGAGLWLIVRNQ